MIHGYHIILPMYGFWLPNDPRGSWSEFVRSWELTRFGKASSFYLKERPLLNSLHAEKVDQRSAKELLKYDPVSLTGLQALSIGHGFGKQVTTSQYTIWACAILPEHTHLVVARHSYKAEQIANLLKGAAIS